MAKILVVDDEQNLLWLLEEVLKGQGHAVFTAGNGLDALRIVETEQPQLVITDVMMPVMDGYGLLENIKAKPESQNIKVILVSAAPIRRNLPFLPDEYVDKPYDLETIETVVAKMLAPD